MTTDKAALIDQPQFQSPLDWFRWRVTHDKKFEHPQTNAIIAAIEAALTESAPVTDAEAQEALAAFGRVVAIAKAYKADESTGGNYKGANESNRRAIEYAEQIVPRALTRPAVTDKEALEACERVRKRGCFLPTRLQSEHWQDCVIIAAALQSAAPTPLSDGEAKKIALKLGWPRWVHINDCHLDNFARAIEKRVREGA